MSPSQVSMVIFSNDNDDSENREFLGDGDWDCSGTVPIKRQAHSDCDKRALEERLENAQSRRETRGELRAERLKHLTTE